jgi:hypothetical protein
MPALGYLDVDPSQDRIPCERAPSRRSNGLKTTLRSRPPLGQASAMYPRRDRNVRTAGALVNSYCGPMAAIPLGAAFGGSREVRAQAGTHAVRGAAWTHCNRGLARDSRLRDAPDVVPSSRRRC